MTGSKGRLLVVDDEPSVLKIVEAILKQAGYSAVTCESGTEALKLLNIAQFDCIVTDANMPVMSGYDLTRAIRRHPVYSEAPVLMLTRKRNRVDVKRAVDAGVTDYVLKPIDEQLFLDKVVSCILKGEGKRHVFELQFVGADAQASMNVDCRILSMSETDITLRTPVSFPPDLSFGLASRVFTEMGIEQPVLKIVSSEPIVESVFETGARPVAAYRVKVAFMGMEEANLMKIRSWLQREAVKQRR